MKIVTYGMLQISYNQEVGFKFQDNELHRYPHTYDPKNERYTIIAINTQPLPFAEMFDHTPLWYWRSASYADFLPNNSYDFMYCLLAMLQETSQINGNSIEIKFGIKSKNFHRRKYNLPIIDPTDAKYIEAWKQEWFLCVIHHNNHEQFTHDIIKDLGIYGTFRMTPQDKSYLTVSSIDSYTPILPPHSVYPRKYQSLPIILSGEYSHTYYQHKINNWIVPIRNHVGWIYDNVSYHLQSYLSHIGKYGNVAMTYGSVFPQAYCFYDIFYNFPQKLKAVKGEGYKPLEGIVRKNTTINPSGYMYQVRKQPKLQSISLNNFSKYKHKNYIFAHPDTTEKKVLSFLTNYTESILDEYTPPISTSPSWHLRPMRGVK